MPRPLKTLRVIVNSFLVLDHDGRPSARVNEDPDHHSPDNRMVGAVHKAEVIEARSPTDMRNPLKGDNRPSVHEHWLDCSTEPSTVPDTPYYRQRIREGTLLPANAATAKVLAVPFRDPSVVIAETARDQAMLWAREHGGEIPEWAAGGKVDEMHPSHACHARVLAVHASKLPAPKPAASSVKPGSP